MTDIPYLDDILDEHRRNGRFFPGDLVIPLPDGGMRIATKGDDIMSKRIGPETWGVWDGTRIVFDPNEVIPIKILGTNEVIPIRASGTFSAVGVIKVGN